MGIYYQDEELEILYGEYGFLAGHSGYVLLPFELGGLDGLPESLTFDYNVLFDEHPSHLAFLLVEYNWATGVFANESGTSLGFLPDDRRHTFELAAPNRLGGLLPHLLPCNFMNSVAKEQERHQAMTSNNVLYCCVEWKGST